jgi:hypothetical protein
MIGLPDVLQTKVKVVKSDTISAFFAKLEVFLRQHVDKGIDDVLESALAIIFGHGNGESMVGFTPIEYQHCHQLSAIMVHFSLHFILFSHFSFLSLTLFSFLRIQVDDAENEILWYSVTIDDVLRHLGEVRLICEECSAMQRQSLTHYVQKLMFSPVMKRLCVLYPTWSNLARNDLDLCQFLLRCVVENAMVDESRWTDILQKILHWDDETEVLVQTFQPLTDFIVLKLFDKSEQTQTDREQSHPTFFGQLIPVYIQASALGRSLLLSSLPNLVKASTIRSLFFKELGQSCTGLLKALSLEEFVNGCVPLRCQEEVEKIISTMRKQGVNDQDMLEKSWRAVYDFTCGIISHSLSHVRDDHVGTDLHRTASRFIECNLEVANMLHIRSKRGDLKSSVMDSSDVRVVSPCMEGRMFRMLFGMAQMIERLMGFQSTPEVLDSIRLFHETIYITISEHGVSSFIGTESNDRHSLRAKTCVCVSQMVEIIHDITEKCGSRHSLWSLFSHMEFGNAMCEDAEEEEDPDEDVLEEDTAEIVKSWSRRFGLSDLSYFTLVHCIWFNNRRASSLKAQTGVKSPGWRGSRARVGDSLGAVKERELDRSLLSCIRVCRHSFSSSICAQYLFESIFFIIIAERTHTAILFCSRLLQQLIDWNAVPKPKRPLLSWFFGDSGMKQNESEEIDVPPIPYLTLRCTECHQEHGFHSLGELETMCVEEDVAAEETKKKKRSLR